MAGAGRQIRLVSKLGHEVVFFLDPALDERISNRMIKFNIGLQIGGAGAAYASVSDFLNKIFDSVPGSGNGYDHHAQWGRSRLKIAVTFKSFYG